MTTEKTTAQNAASLAETKDELIESALETVTGGDKTTGGTKGGNTPVVFIKIKLVDILVSS